MDKTFLAVLPLALAATISPSGLLFVMMILSGKDKPKTKSLQFVLGAAAFLFILGLITFLTFKPAINATAHPSATSAIIDIIFGVLILGVIVHSVFGKKKDKTDNKKHNIPYILIGFLYMIINVSTLLPYVAALKIISTNKLGVFDDFWMFIVVLLITMLMVSFPVVITYALPNSSKKILDPTTRFFSKYGKTIANVYFFAIAIYLIAKGVIHF
ncbi:MAG: GAP family protein [Candidatus Saccharibacteria bacterium]